VKTESRSNRLGWSVRETNLDRKLEKLWNVRLINLSQWVAWLSTLITTATNDVAVWSWVFFV